MNPEISKAEPLVKAATSLKDDYIKKLEAEGKEWDAQLALWAAKLDTKSVQLKADFHQWQRDFQARRGEALKKLDTLSDSGHHAWEEMKTGAQTAWDDMKAAFESAKKKFN